ncbi:MAG: multidrug ABC transporter ATP-binding protein [Chromatiales bacterium]|jgi:ABC-2 type transport system ATP-binding protein|nr:MAG: multidrug ABC transporter ATP-binding protein [Chromatiales bacterium]
MAALIEARGLCKRYGATAALDNTSFSIEAGRIVGLIGPNGAGKTTALKAILGLTPFEGGLSVLGRDPRRERHELMQDVCFIADVAVLPRWIKVQQVLDMADGVHPKFNKGKAQQFLSRTDIPMTAKVKTLSKGMVTQLHLALVMAIDARLLVLDEPTIGLDIIYRKEFYSSLLNDYFDEERTILVTTHQVEEIQNVLTDLLFINRGRIVLDCSMDEVAERYTEVLVGPEKIEQARALGPIYEQDTFGRKVLLFEAVGRAELEQLGEARRPSISDLFVAKVKGGRA